MEDVVNIKANKQEATTTVTDSDTNTYILSKPFEWEGKTYTKLKLDFEKLVGMDMIAIESEMATHGEYALSPEISTSYLSKLAARAAGVGADVIEHMPIRDFGKVKNKARDFLLSTGLTD